MNYTVQVGSGAMIYMPSFIKTSSGIQMLGGGGLQTVFWTHNAFAYFFLKYALKCIIDINKMFYIWMGIRHVLG
jgi:hypothetical protein